MLCREALHGTLSACVKADAVEIGKRWEEPGERQSVLLQGRREEAPWCWGAKERGQSAALPWLWGTRRMWKCWWSPTEFRGLRRTLRLIFSTAFGEKKKKPT